MAKNKAQLGIAGVAVALALVAALLVWRGLAAVMSPIKVLAATRVVVQMTPITPADLTVESVPKGQLGSQQYVRPNQEALLIGRLPLYGLFPGEIVSPVDIAPYSAMTSMYAAQLANLRKQAARAVAVAQRADAAAKAAASKAPAPAVPGKGAPAAAASSGVPTVAAANAALAAAMAAQATVDAEQAVTVSITEPQGFAIVKPGDRVTIYGTIQDAQKTMAAFPVANDVLVLGQLGTSQGGALNGAVSGMLVLALAPNSIERLMLSQQAGSLQVALMPLGAPPIHVGTVTSTSLLNGAPLPAAAPHYQTAASASAKGAVVP